MTKRSWVQVNGKLIPKEEFHGTNSRAKTGILFIPDIEPFVSPVDGKIINSRPQLRAHNKFHDVTNYADFSPEYIQKKVQERQQRLHGQTPQDKQDRIEHLKRALDNHRS